jgi:hypothetical protein
MLRVTSSKPALKQSSLKLRWLALYSSPVNKPEAPIDPGANPSKQCPKRIAARFQAHLSASHSAGHLQHRIELWP